jgi:hypothetical protein
MRKPPKPSAAFSEADKARVTSACQRLIEDFLKPRFLPSVQPTQFNYPVDILGGWHGTKYRNLGEEFDAPFARLDWISPNRFDIQWHRHTGEWFRLHRGLTLEKAIETSDPTAFCIPFRLGRTQCTLDSASGPPNRRSRPRWLRAATEVAMARAAMVELWYCAPSPRWSGFSSIPPPRRLPTSKQLGPAGCKLDYAPGRRTLNPKTPSSPDELRLLRVVAHDPDIAVVESRRERLLRFPRSLSPAHRGCAAIPSRRNSESSRTPCWRRSRPSRRTYAVSIR